MKIELDEDLPVELVSSFTTLGQDVHTVPEEGLAGIDDGTVFLRRRVHRAQPTFDFRSKTAVIGRFWAQFGALCLPDFLSYYCYFCPGSKCCLPQAVVRFGVPPSGGLSPKTA